MPASQLDILRGMQRVSKVSDTWPQGVLAMITTVITLNCLRFGTRVWVVQGLGPRVRRGLGCGA